MKPKNKNQNKPHVSFTERFNKFCSNKYFVGALLVILTFVFYVNYSAIYDKKIDMNGDNIYYYALAKSLNEGHGYSNTMGFDVTPHTHFPPGYPAFASCVMKVFGDDIQTIKKANGFLMYGSVVLLFFIAFITTKNSVLGFCAGVLTSMHSELLRTACIMMSETLFVFLSLLAVFLAILLSRWNFEKGKWWLFIVLAVLLTGVSAFIYFVRTMGLTIILAMAAWSGIMALVSLVKWLRTKKKQPSADIRNHKLQFIVRIGIAVLVLLSAGTAKMSWDHRNAQYGVEGSDYAAAFGTKLNNEQMQGKEDWVKRIKFNTSHFVGHWIPTAVFFREALDTETELETKITGKEWFHGLLLLGIIVVGGCYGWEQLLLLIYIGITLGVLTLYPEQYGGTRYIVPIEPVFILLFLSGFCAIVAGLMRLLKAKSATLILQVIVVLAVTFMFVSPKYSEAQTTNRNLAKMKSWITDYDVPRDSYLRACEYCADSIPDTARVACRKPELFYMYSKYRHSIMIPRYAEPDTVLKFFVDNKIDYVIVDIWFKHAYYTVWPCIAKYPDKFKMVKQLNEQDTARKFNPTYVMYFNNEWGYEGDLVDGKREGHGVWKMQDGRVYEGSFAHGLPNGYGEITDTAGMTHKGIWKDGAMSQFQGSYRKK